MPTMPPNLPIALTLECHNCQVELVFETRKKDVNAATSAIYEKSIVEGWETLKIGKTIIGTVCRTCTLEFLDEDENDDTPENLESAKPNVPDTDLAPSIPESGNPPPAEKPKIPEAKNPNYRKSTDCSDDPAQTANIRLLADS